MYTKNTANTLRSYETTLSSIIPLPDPSTPLSQLETFPRNSIVLGLYPDTTAFYQATVISPPLLSSGLGARAGAKADRGAKDGKYILSFVDDEDKRLEVDPRDVVTVCLFLSRACDRDDWDGGADDSFRDELDCGCRWPRYSVCSCYYHYLGICISSMNQYD